MNAGNWITLGSALVAALSAWLASRSAGRARTAEGEAERLRHLEERVAERKYVMYKPMIDLLARALDPLNAKAIDTNKLRTTTADFTTWLGVFGSDDAVRAFRNFMQGTYMDAPQRVTLRLYADLLLAARRDMGDPKTKIGPDEIMGMRLKDLYSNLATHDQMTLSFEKLCDAEDWDIPWLQTPDADAAQPASVIA